MLDWLKETGVSSAELARRLGVTRQTVQGWIDGAFRPSIIHLRQLELLTGNVISAASFVSEEELRRVQHG